MYAEWCRQKTILLSLVVHKCWLEASLFLEKMLCLFSSDLGHGSEMKHQTTPYHAKEEKSAIHCTLINSFDLFNDKKNICECLCFWRLTFEMKNFFLFCKQLFLFSCFASTLCTIFEFFVYLVKNLKFFQL